MKKTAVICLLLILIATLYGCEKKAAKATGEYETVDKLEVDFDYQNVKAYKIGADRKGNPVFYDAKKALKQAQKDYAEGFSYLQTEYGLQDVEEDYEAYKEYGWQTQAADDEIVKQCTAISSFLDIYENSYE